MRFLIIRLDGLGDTVLSTPLLRALRDGFPGCHIACVASPVGAACLETHPGVDDLLVVSPRTSTLGEKLALGRRLYRGRYDVAITITEKAWGLLWAWMSRAPRRIGFWAGSTQPVKALLFGPTLTDRIPSPNDPRVPSHLHEVERHMRLLEPLGVNAPPGPAWMLPPLTPDRTDRVVLHLSTKWMTQGWTQSWLEDVAQSLSQASEGRLLLTAGAEDGAWAEEFASRIANCGPQVLFGTRFDAWTAALASSRVLVSMDTGAVHVAAALGLPVVDVFARAGAEHVVPRWKPWQVAHEVVLRGRGDDHAETSRVRDEIVTKALALRDSLHVG